MAKEIDKIIKSPTPPKDTNVGWYDGKTLRFFNNGEWSSTTKTDDTVVTPNTQGVNIYVATMLKEDINTAIREEYVSLSWALQSGLKDLIEHSGEHTALFVLNVIYSNSNRQFFEQFLCNKRLSDTEEAIFEFRCNSVCDGTEGSYIIEINYANARVYISYIEI